MTSRPVLHALTAMALVGALAACSKPTADEHIARAEEYRTAAQLAEAVIEYRTALQIDPQRGDVRLRLAEVYLEQRNPSQALREYVRAADLLPGDVSVQLTTGGLLLFTSAYDDAKGRATKVLELEPSNAEALVLMGNALAGLQDLDGALTRFQQAIALNPGQEGAYAGMATIQLAQGDLEAAEASFNKAVEVTPDSLSARLARANFLWASRRPVEAEQEFKAALEIDPADVVANRALGVFYLSSNRAAEAEPHFKAIADAVNTPEAVFALSDYYVMTDRLADARQVLQDLAEEDKAWADATTRLAAIDAAEGMRAQGAVRLREVLEKFPDDRPARLLMARILLADGKRDEALAQASTIVQEAPNSPVAADAYMVIGQVHTALDRPEAAVRAYQEALARSQQPFAVDVALASLHLSSGETEKATTYVQQALQAQPGQPDARALYVRILIAAGETAQARVELTSLEREFPNAPAVLSLLGSLQMAEGQMAAARASFTKAAELAPSDLVPLGGLVQIDLRTDRTADALARIEDGLRVVDRSSDLLILAARTYAAAGQWDRTEELLTEAIELDQARLRGYALLAQAYLRQNRLAEAEHQFETVIESDPTSVSANTMLGIIYDMQGNVDEAEAQYVKTLALDRTAAVAANNLAYRYADANRNLDEALQLAQTAQQRLPGEPNVADTLGWVYYRKGFTSAAVRELEAAVATSTTDPLIRYHLGMAYHQAGELDRARETLRQALALGTGFSGVEEARKTLAELGG